MEDAVESVARKLSGISGPRGTEYKALQRWLLKFGENSNRLRYSVETFVYWIANGSLPWVAYCSFMSRRLIALAKHTGVRPVGVEETWRRLFSKIVLKFTGPEATMACQDEQLCAGLEAVIDGAIYGVQDLWEKNLLQRNGVFYF